MNDDSQSRTQQFAKAVDVAMKPHVKTDSSQQQQEVGMNGQQQQYTQYTNTYEPTDSNKRRKSVPRLGWGEGGEQAKLGYQEEPRATQRTHRWKCRLHAF